MGSYAARRDSVTLSKSTREEKLPRMRYSKTRPMFSRRPARTDRSYNKDSAIHVIDIPENKSRSAVFRDWRQVCRTTYSARGM